MQNVEDEQRSAISNQIVLDLGIICIEQIHLQKVSRTYVARTVSARDTGLNRTTHRREVGPLKTLAYADHWQPAPEII